MLDGLHTSVELVTNKRWLGMIIAGICDLGEEGTRAVATLELTISGTSSEQHYLYLFSPCWSPINCSLPPQCGGREARFGCALWS